MSMIEQVGYESSFVATPRAEAVLRSGRIIEDHESPAHMIERVAGTLAAQESEFSGRAFASRFETELGEMMDSGAVVMSTPIMTNAGRHFEKPLSACTVPTMSMTGDRALLAQEISTLHQQGMGTGFSFNEVDDPTQLLRFLNEKAVDGANSGAEERPVGNMGILSVYHPGVLDFIQAKIDAPENGKSWKFNISVDVDEAFFKALEDDGEITLQDGQTVSATRVFETITEAAYKCADPGLIFLDRMNYRNPTPELGEYKTTAPCAEVGLIEGEACQFGYINLGHFVELGSDGVPRVDYDQMEQVSHTLTRALDDALEVSLGRYASPRSVYVMENKRKIGIGVCGVADALNILGLPYDSEEARTAVQDMLARINYASKQASVQLGEERGSCGAMSGFPGSRHTTEIPLIEQLYGSTNTAGVRSEDWVRLARNIRDTRILRNVTTVSLPPTGRSALVIDASTGVEPHFRTSDARDKSKDALFAHLSVKYGREIARRIADNDFNVLETNMVEAYNLLADATEITPLGHIAMAAACQTYSDEAVAKTINLPETSTPQDIADIYIRARMAGMSGITVYREGTYGAMQPKALDKK